MDTRPSATAERMRLAAEAVAKGTGTREQLKAAARALVLELRSASEPPEQMLLRVKEILTDGGLRATYASSDPSVAARGDASIYRTIIEWSIRQYYDGNDDGGTQGATS